MRNLKKFTGKAAFTLVELLIVIAIIAILASLVLAAAGGVQKKGARSRAEGEIAALGAALESFKADNGDYPTNSSTNSSSCLVTNLMPTNGGKVYYEFKTKWIDSYRNYLDPFGYSYNYIYTNGSPNNGTNNYDLWSTAGNLTDTNTQHWIKNW
jgi:prepilin-type N-terminal cleavage/methylation domain-containing protein